MQNLENFAFDTEDEEEEDAHVWQQETSEKLQLDRREKKQPGTAENDQ